MPWLSAVIVARDEKQDLERAVRAASFADEVLVMDSRSPERVPDGSRPPGGARVVRHSFEGDGPTWRRAVAEAAHDWVLCLEADEEVTPELAAAIESLLADGQPRYPAYRTRLVTAFMGRPLTHGADTNQRPIRLFDRRRAGWSSAPVLAEIVVSGAVGRLPGAVLHHALRDLSDGIAWMDAESSLAALGVAMSGRRPGGLVVVLTAASQFSRYYVLKQGFRNGFPGLAWSFMKAVGSAMTYLKARELVASSGSSSGQSQAEPPGLRAPGPPRGGA